MAGGDATRADDGGVTTGGATGGDATGGAGVEEATGATGAGEDGGDGEAVAGAAARSVVSADVAVSPTG